MLVVSLRSRNRIFLVTSKDVLPIKVSLKVVPVSLLWDSSPACFRSGQILNFL